MVVKQARKISQILTFSPRYILHLTNQYLKETTLLTHHPYRYFLQDYMTNVQPFYTLYFNF
jgi:hypothetical protein